VVEHYGFKTLMYGTLLPGPDIGRRCADILRGVHDGGFETGIHCWDHVKWQDNVERADAAWTGEQMQLAADRYAEVFGEPARVHGAAGWQMNAQALRLTQRLGFSHASDTRGSHPFMPVQNGEIVLCPQLPTTLPTLDELIGIDGTTEDNVHEKLLALTAQRPAHGSHVYTLHAELEGMKLMPAFERLLTAWREQGYELVSLRDLAAALDRATLPRHEVVRGEIAGRSGTLMLQGPEFLA
jgi:peptidoglycan/xylan/chitin deacetylase (PgdA/CDA1 family)